MPSPRNSESSLRTVSPAVDALLSKLRQRIRWFVLLEGVATAVAILLLAFWISLAIDYLPVTIGFPELSRLTRIIILLVVGAMVGRTFSTLVLRRVFVSLKNRSMAMLIERKYPKFSDSLLTTVTRSESKSGDIPVDESMFGRTKLQAESLLADVELSQVINSGPLKRSLMCGAVLLASVVAFGVAKPATIKLAGQRLYLLQDDLWPRRNQVEIVGIKVKRENTIEGIDELGQTQLEVNGEFRVAKGATLTLMIRAAGGDENDARILPTNCSLIYETKEGNGVQTFKRIGIARDGFQLYSFDGQLFRGVLDDIKFDVRGGDHRIGPFKINVVPSPDVFETKLDCKFPEYIVDQASGSWLERVENWTGQARYPEGTDVTILARSNKPLEKVYVLDRKNQTMKTIRPENSNFTFNVGALKETVSLQFFLCDVDGIVAEQPHTINIEPIADQPPIVNSRLTGIGTAVTPDVQIPFAGTVDDDHGLERTWVEIKIADAEPILESVTVNSGEFDLMLDFKQRRQEVGPRYELPVKEGSTVQLVLKSEDKYNLGEGPNLGIGDRYTLDVVSPNQLVRILERLEVGQRRRIEQIYLEIADVRNYLVRCKSSSARAESIGADLVEPGEDERAEPDDDEGQPEIREQELRLLFSQRAILQIDKSIQEILGSAEAFENIRLQLINNRIDSEDRKNRFSEQIIAPLRLIGGQSMQQLKDTVEQLETGLRDLQLSPLDGGLSAQNDMTAIDAIELTDVVLSQLDGVLNVLIKYETQNELLEIVRQMIKQQQALKERTKKERQRKAFDGLLD